MDPEHDSARLPSIARMDDTLALLETGFVSPGASGDALAAGRRAAAVAARSGAPSGRGRSGLLTGLLVCLQCCPPCRRSTDEGVAFSRSASATYRPEAACGGKAPDSFDPPRPPSCTAALSGEGAVRRRAGGLCEDGCARREIDCPHSKFEFAHSKSSSGAFVFFLTGSAGVGVVRVRAIAALPPSPTSTPSCRRPRDCASFGAVSYLNRTCGVL